MRISKKQIAAFQQKILSWYAANKRDLPWRKTRDPYKILVSEVMLQQTQVSRVVPKYEAWLAAFPTVAALAKATTVDILRLWSGLGYNRRALYLQKTAQTIAADYKGKWPHNVAELKKLPGVGEYTARAIACFAFGQQVAVVDTNIRKVILLKFLKKCHCEDPVKRGTKQSQNHQKDCYASLAMTKNEKEIQRIADQLLPYGQAYEWNQALMDYSAAVLRKEKIPIVKQSKFIGSNRYYRGKLIRLLLQQKEIPVSKLGFLLKEDFTETDRLWLKALLHGLRKDQFIVLRNGIVMIASKE